MFKIRKCVGTAHYVISCLLFLQISDTDAQNSFDFRTRVLAEDRLNRLTANSTTSTVRPPVSTLLPVHRRARLRLQELIDRRTKPVCTKEVLTRTLIVQPHEKPERNTTTKHISVITTCCDGLKPHPFDDNKCVPDCGDKCINGQCVAPNICRCYPGFVPNLSQDCVTTCPLGCINGRCYSNGTCICNPGYHLEPKGAYCIPICGDGCGAGRNCSAPGVCSCYEGYGENPRGKCIPICKRDCLHGTCIAPNTCSCNPGYHLKDGVCQANCFQKCIHGKCISQNHCMCDEGYYFDPSIELCVPRCRNCHNGVCVAPEKCRCFDGYKNTDDPGTCSPHCTGGCYGGLCYAPEKCDCTFYTINVLEHCRSTGKCLLFFGGVCLWWVDY